MRFPVKKKNNAFFSSQIATSFFGPPLCGGSCLCGRPQQPTRADAGSQQRPLGLRKLQGQWWSMGVSIGMRHG